MSYGDKAWRDEQIRLAGGNPGASSGTTPSDVLRTLGSMNATTTGGAVATPAPQTNALRDYINTTFYQGALGRQGDEEGLNYWTNEAQVRGWDNDQLLRQMVDSAGITLAQSDEARQRELAPALFAQLPEADLAPSLGDAPQYTPYTSAPLPTYTPYTSTAAPELAQFQSEEFNFEADPGYAFRKQQADEAMQKRQLATGNFFSGGALKEAADYGSGLASQEYGNAFQRYLQNDANAFRNTQGNNANLMTTWGANDAAGFRNNQANFGNQMNQWQAADASGFRSNQANFENAFSRFKTLNDTAYDRSWNSEMRDYNRFVDDFNRGRAVDDTNWNRLTYLDQSGQNAANQTASVGQNTATNIGNLQVGAGNAQAGGYINSANSWTNAIGNALYSMRNQGGPGQQQQQKPSMFGGYYS